ncbi:hypothetical protein TNCT_265961 [Trichonephila clavata]|uniref:Uncharacterized protein n=1 Tax=Trichonephila clavata TaxID=2740835 RepID=A0A8X6K7Z7_TRICU|nr:hypothetical protein TNCT_265961 [Trichonephila clavata]
MVRDSLKRGQHHRFLGRVTGVICAQKSSVAKCGKQLTERERVAATGLGIENPNIYTLVVRVHWLGHVKVASDRRRGQPRLPDCGKKKNLSESRIVLGILPLLCVPKETFLLQEKCAGIHISRGPL